MDSEFPMRINKYLAKAGYATRRSADRLIEDGKVFVNGKKAELGQKVMETDLVEIKDFDSSKFRYLLYNKPLGVTTLSNGPEGTDIAKQILNDHSITGLFPIGRLDKDIEGLIVLTNDGRLTSRILEVPDKQEYEVTVDKQVKGSTISKINRGVKIEKHIARSLEAETIKGRNNEFKISIGEDKRYNVRSVCAAIGLKVIKLKRIKMFNFELKRLKPGEFYELKPKEIKALHRTLGLH